MKAEISFDLIMDEDMGFVEGCYRLAGGEWEVFIIAHTGIGSSEPEVRNNLRWPSGVRGLNAFVPLTTKLNKSAVLHLLSDTLSVTEWSEVQGPDSIILR
jgi:hypothetical protein